MPFDFDRAEIVERKAAYIAMHVNAAPATSHDAMIGDMRNRTEIGMDI